MSINQKYLDILPKDMMELECLKLQGTPEEKIKALEHETLLKFRRLRKSTRFWVPLIIGAGGLISSVALFKVGISVGITILVSSVACIFLAFSVLGLMSIITGLQWLVFINGVKAQISAREFYKVASELGLTVDQKIMYHSAIFENTHSLIIKTIKKVEDEFTGNEHE